MDIQEIIKDLESKYECNFRYSHLYEMWKADISKGEYFEIHISRYDTDDERHGQEFISVGYTAPHRGYGKPCDTMDEVYALMDKHFDKKLQISFFEI